jgi:hypothetical protein
MGYFVGAKSQKVAKLPNFQGRIVAKLFNFRD